jgi:dTDP-4-amino-4,6-dideoxygalactose transaminase
VSTVTPKQIPLLDLKTQHRDIRDEIIPELMRVIDSQMFIMGEEVQKLEEELAPYCGARFAIGCGSGSDALFLALLAMDVGHGDEVLTTPYTFFATAGAIVRAGARPVFVDVEPDTFNMNMASAREALAAHPAIKAIIPVHLFGACADMDTLMHMANERGVPVIEDAAQSIGSEYKGRRAGSIGSIGCFSFFPSKNLGGYGDGGMLTTNSEEWNSKLRALRVHGAPNKYYHEWVGVNSRLDAIQAAVLRVKFRHLDSWTEGRRKNAAQYRTRLAELGVPVIAPIERDYANRHIYNQFVIRAESRDRLQVFLKDHGIGTEVYYPLPLHLQHCFDNLGYRKGDFPVSEMLAGDALALPVHSGIAGPEILHVCETIRAFYAS